jgi:hypothetical protein
MSTSILQRPSQDLVLNFKEAAELSPAQGAAAFIEYAQELKAQSPYEMTMVEMVYNAIDAVSANLTQTQSEAIHYAKRSLGFGQ